MGEQSTIINAPHIATSSFGYICETFSAEEVDFICQCLFQWEDGARLVHLFAQNLRLLRHPVSSTVKKAYLFALFHQRQFDMLFRVMADNEFERRDHEDLAKLWFSAHYEEERQRKHKELVPVDKYRIRKKYPPPKSVCEEEKVYSFTKGDRRILREYFEKDKYPKTEQKLEIERKTGLSSTQIANWFKNRRQREKTDLK
ncbi:hypothetical protein niasHT_013004 [Heterodera trifolii]|uniref:Homeobox domain-containing protein n=1 Tax=Heterodera trifolii TaxID=157864 RepID=A0ABD2L3K0_9BILA